MPDFVEVFAISRRGAYRVADVLCQSSNNYLRAGAASAHHISAKDAVPGAASFARARVRVMTTRNHMPRLVPEKNAAAHYGLELATFRAWVASGRLPEPIPDCGLYDLKAIDLALDRISGIGTPGNALDAWRAKGSKTCA
jgi:hypothetical protein